MSFETFMQKRDQTLDRILNEIDPQTTHEIIELPMFTQPTDFIQRFAKPFFLIIGDQEIIQRDSIIETMSATEFMENYMVAKNPITFFALQDGIVHKKYSHLREELDEVEKITGTKKPATSYLLDEAGLFLSSAMNRYFSHADTNSTKLLENLYYCLFNCAQIDAIEQLGRVELSRSNLENMLTNSPALEQLNHLIEQSQDIESQYIGTTKKIAKNAIGNNIRQSEQCFLQYNDQHTPKTTQKLFPLYRQIQLCENKELPVETILAIKHSSIGDNYIVGNLDTGKTVTIKVNKEEIDEKTYCQIICNEIKDQDVLSTIQSKRILI